ncbi:hypothetical protein BGW42_005539 [Actinomortierella wolfii]|nr:hypothetical protein BGW42_005539 [Actinomortierella wolfii]
MFSSPLSNMTEQESFITRPPPGLPVLQSYSKPQDKTLFGFDSGFFGSQSGTQALEQTYGINSSSNCSSQGSGASSSLLDQHRLSYDYSGSFMDHSAETLYRDRDRRTLYIQNLDLDCNDHKLWKICSQFGTVISAKAIIDPWSGICEGHGFVTFDTELTAVRTQRALCARGYIANLRDDVTDPGKAMQPLPHLSDLYQLSNSLDDGGHGVLDVRLTDYLHRLASGARPQEHYGNHVERHGSSSGSSGNRSCDLQPFYTGDEKDDALMEPLEPEHPGGGVDQPVVYFCNLAQGIKYRNLFELCASYGPVVLHLSDFATMDDVCTDGKGQVQFTSLQDAWGAAEVLTSLGYDVQLGTTNRVSEDTVMPMADISDPHLTQMHSWQENGGVDNYAIRSDVASYGENQPQDQGDEMTVSSMCNTRPSSSSSPGLLPVASGAATAPSSLDQKNDSAKAKVFSFADAVKKAPAALPPTPPPTFKDKAVLKSGSGGSTPQDAKASPPMIRMPIPTEQHNIAGPSLTKMGGVQTKLDKSEYRMNLYVRDLEPDMTDLKLYEICVQFGRVLSCRVVTKNGVCQGLGFVMFTTQESAEKARIGLKMHGYHAHVAGHAATTKLRCKTMSETVFLMNLPSFVKDYHIRELFKHYGIVSCSVLFHPQTGKSRGVGFLKLKDLETAERFIHENHGRLMGKDWKLPLQVLPARHYNK